MARSVSNVGGGVGSIVCVMSDHLGGEEQGGVVGDTSGELGSRACVMGEYVSH